MKPSNRYRPTGGMSGKPGLGATLSRRRELAFELLSRSERTRKRTRFAVLGAIAIGAAVSLME